MNKKYIYIIFGLVALTFAIGFFGIRPLITQNKYLKIPPQKGEITEAVYGLGKVKSKQTYEVKLGFTSVVQKIFVSEGDFVSKDQNLMQLDSKVVFKAPFAGVITWISIHQGETASPQTVLLRLENLNDRYIELSLEQDGALRIQKNQSAKVTFESLRGEVLQGTVRSIFPKQEEFIAVVEVNSLSPSILPGMSADVSIEVGKVEGTLVPLKSVRNGVVLIERKGRQKKIKVELGLVDGLSAEIRSPSFEPDDLVLVPKEK